MVVFWEEAGDHLADGHLVKPLLDISTPPAMVCSQSTVRFKKLKVAGLWTSSIVSSHLLPAIFYKTPKP